MYTVWRAVSGDSLSISCQSDTWLSFILNKKITTTLTRPYSLTYKYITKPYL